MTHLVRTLPILTLHALICNTTSIRYAQNDDRTAGGHKFSLCWGAREDVPDDETGKLKDVRDFQSLMDYAFD